MIRVDVAAPLQAALGESPVWDADNQILHLVDIIGKRIHQLDPATGDLTTIDVDGMPGAIALRRGGGYIAGIGLDFATIEPDGTTTRLARATAGDRVNDGKCDARGRFIAGTMDGSERLGAAALYQLLPDGALERLLPDVALSNGLDWNLAGDRLYYIDTTTRRVDVLEYDVDTGRVGERQTFADLKDAAGRPDGLTVDAEGGVWVAVARAGMLHRYEPDGRLDTVVQLPTRMVTSCAFGGSDLRDLFVTSSRALLPEAERANDPVAGAVFVLQGLGVTGRLPHKFGEGDRGSST